MLDCDREGPKFVFGFSVEAPRRIPESSEMKFPVIGDSARRERKISIAVLDPLRAWAGLAIFSDGKDGNS